MFLLWIDKIYVNNSDVVNSCQEEHTYKQVLDIYDNNSTAEASNKAIDKTYNNVQSTNVTAVDRLGNRTVLTNTFKFIFVYV